MFTIKRLAEVRTRGKKLPIEVIDIPEEQDQFVGNVKIEAMGYKLGALTPEQEAYIKDYNAGT